MAKPTHNDVIQIQKDLESVINLARKNSEQILEIQESNINQTNDSSITENLLGEIKLSIDNIAQDVKVLSERLDKTDEKLEKTSKTLETTKKDVSSLKRSNTKKSKTEDNTDGE